MFEKYGLADAAPAGSRRERVRATTEALSDADCIRVARIIADDKTLSTEQRFAAQEALWVDDPNYPRIDRRARRELAQDLLTNSLHSDGAAFIALLSELWPINDDLYALEMLMGRAPGRASLRAQIEQHVLRNPEDWSTEDLWERLGALDASDRRFISFP